MPLRLRSQGRPEPAPKATQPEPEKRTRKKKQKEPEVPPPPDTSGLRLPPGTAEQLATRRPVVRLTRYTRNGEPPQEPEVPRPTRTRKKRIRQPQEDPEEAREVENVMLPSASLFPGETDSIVIKQQKLKEIWEAVRRIYGVVLNKIQEDGDNFIWCYESIENVYEYFDKKLGSGWGDGRKWFGEKYRIACLGVLYEFGAVIWKQTDKKSSSYNPFAVKAANFLEHCFVHLGWESDKRKEGYLKEKKSDYDPACYIVLKFFHKYHNDITQSSRAHQLNLILKFLQTATATNNQDYIKVAWNVIGKCIQIRLKDKHPQCRILVLHILSHFTALDEAVNSFQKEVKFYTRYDDSAEVRKIGTRIIGESTGIQMRYFYDQAFDKNEGVRYEAFKAMGVEWEDGGLIREMGSIAGEKICKAIVWGTMFSGAKCKNLLKSEILPTWLKISCNSDLVKFLATIDAYKHMKAVVKILDMLLTTEDQERFVEQLDLTFIQSLKENVRDRNYKNVSIEAFVGWLGLCKASETVASIRSKVIPTSGEIIELVNGLHTCVNSEHEHALEGDMSEDVTPVFCLVITLEIAKRFVAWDEGNRTTFISQLNTLLMDPLLDDRVIVIQSMNTLHKFVDSTQFEDMMMRMFQDVFDKDHKEYNRGHTSGSEVSVDNLNYQVAEQDPPRPQPAQPAQPVKKTPYELTKLRSELCDLAMLRVQLQNVKEELIKKQMFIDCVEVTDRLKEIMDKEAGLRAEICELEGISRAAPLVGPAERVEVRKSFCAPQSQRERELEELSVFSSSHDGGVINTLEEGLAKGLFMMNAYLDVCPKIGSFFRNIYDSHVYHFMAEEDRNIRVSVLQFMTRFALIDKRECKRVFSFMVDMLVNPDAEIEVRNAAFQNIVDLCVCYDWGDFVYCEGDKPYDDKSNEKLTKSMREMLPQENITYQTATSNQIERFVLDFLTKRFPPNYPMNATELGILNTTKNVGLLKLLVRGRLRDPKIISKVLILWVNHNYAGTAVLRDLEHVLKLYNTFEWWGEGRDVVVEIDGEDVGGGKPMTRVLGVSVAEGVCCLCGDVGVKGEEVVKFVCYFVSFLDYGDQSLMRTMVQTILNPIINNPTRSYNALLVKCASKIPITSPVSASAIVSVIGEVFQRMKDHPITASVSVLRKELCLFLGKLKRVFGDEICVVNGREIGFDKGWGDGIDTEDEGEGNEGDGEGVGDEEEGNKGFGDEEQVNSEVERDEVDDEGIVV